MSKTRKPTDVGAARAKALLAQLDAVRSSPGVTNVHQTRVACRRMAQSINVLRPVLPKKLRRRAQRAVKAIRKYFGLGRDADVLLQHLHVWLATHPPDHKGATAAAELIAGLAEKRRQHTRDLLRQLRSKEAKAHARAIYAFFSWCSDTEAKVKKRRKKAAPVASSVDDVRASRKRLDEMLAKQALDTTAAGLQHAHDVRIDIKTYRYGVESLTDRKKDLEPFKRCQDALGVVQDMCVLLDLIDRALARTPRLPEPGLEHLSRATGLQALRSDILGTVGANFKTFHKAYAEATQVVERLT